MIEPKKSEIERLENSGHFDREWYASEYQDVSGMGMDPAVHYLKYGHRLNRNASANFSTKFFRFIYGVRDAVDPISWMAHQKKIGKLEAPDVNKVLFAANGAIQNDEFDLPIKLARKYLPKNLEHTISILWANQAIAQCDHDKWLKKINQYLGHHGISPIYLSDGPSLFDSIESDAEGVAESGPLISVLMTTYNAQGTVKRAVNSILNQTWKNLELLIIDDCSEDGTWAELQEVAQSDTRVKVYRNAINIGTYASKNLLLDISAGDWITCQDADDWSHPERLERHLNSIMQDSSNPQASASMMLRMHQDGTIDRLAPISKYSLDGASRDAPISCLFEKNFLKSELGGWDPVRFGADSEMIERVEAITGKEIHRCENIGMFCLISPTGLTSQPDHFIHRTDGPSAKPRQYAASYRKWHAKIRLGNVNASINSINATDARCFDAPDTFVVPSTDILRNYHSISPTSLMSRFDNEITLIVVSMRPNLVEHVAANIKRQTHPGIRLIYIAHGQDTDLTWAEEAFAGIRNVTIMSVDNTEMNLGAAFNEGLKRCETDLVAKMDDDDFYGPNYITRSIAALRFNGDPEVAMTGKGRAYCYVEDLDTMAIRFPANNENIIRKHVFGSTLVWSRNQLSNQLFQEIPRGIDSGFIADALKKGKKIYSGDRYDHVAIRYANVDDHTWKVGSEDFLKPATRIGHGLRLDWAYSTNTNDVGSDQLPNRPVVFG